MANTFPPAVADKLKYYVYRLIDPRNGHTFYVGKGIGDRVFAHAKGIIADDDPLAADKVQRIKEIVAAGFETAHVIHRHGLDDKGALEVEAALIEAYPGLTNIVGGHGSDTYGVAHAEEIVRRYQVEQFAPAHRILLINIGNSFDEEKSLEDATRFAWKIDPERGKQQEIVLAHRRGIVIGVFRASNWMKATKRNFPKLALKDLPGRWGFETVPAEAEIAAQYLQKRVPDAYRRRGAANPIRFIDPLNEGSPPIDN